MRVCLVTWWASRNCGTCLQAYALMRALEGLGCEVHFSDLNQPRFNFKYWVRLVSSIAGVAALLKLARKIASRRAAEKESCSRLQAWVNSTFRVIRLKYPWSLRHLVLTTDCFVSGSDQIWNTYYEGFSPHMFLDVVGESKRISYASSIGTTGVNPIYEEDVKKWLSKYVRIGVREKTGMQVLRELTGRNDIVQVVDPVFLLSAADWRGFESFDRSSLREKYVLCRRLNTMPDCGAV